MERLSFSLMIAGLAVLLVLIIILSLGIGAVPFSTPEVLKALAARLPWLKGRVVADHTTVTIIWDFRLARALLAAAVGAALAVSGAAFQGLFRNPLADPFVIGASSGAALGATLAIVFNLTISLGGFRPIPLAAFTGAVAAVALVYVISQTGSSTPPAVALLLAGAALSSLFSAAVSLLMALRTKDLHQIFFWILGSFSGKSWPHLLSMLPYLFLSFIMVTILTRPLDIIAFGEETARGMGLVVGRARILIVVSASLATAAAVASSGIIGFIGLLAPHAARLIFGPIHKRLIPASALLGAILLVAADDLARTIMAPIELPVGVLTALLGAPFFLYLLRTRQKSLGGD